MEILFWKKGLQRQKPIFRQRVSPSENCKMIIYKSHLRYIYIYFFFRKHDQINPKHLLDWDKKKITPIPEQQSQWNQSPPSEVSHLRSALPHKPPSALTSLTFHPLKRDPPHAAHTDHRRFRAPSLHLPPGRSRVSASGRLTASCSISPKITLHEADASESKFDYDTNVRSGLSLIVLLTFPVLQQKKNPSSTKKTE